MIIHSYLLNGQQRKLGKLIDIQNEFSKFKIPDTSFKMRGT